MTFSDIVDATDALSVDEQETLVAILRRRIVEQNRQQLAREIQEARGEFSDGQARTASAREIMDEAAGEA